MIVGPDKKTVVNLGMTVGTRAKHLEMSREDFRGKCVLRPVETRIIMAALKAVGNVIHGRGLEEAWIEDDTYNIVIIKILGGKHMRGTFTAHETAV